MNTTKSMQFKRGAVAVAIFASLLAACGRESPEALVASAKSYLAKSDYKAASIQLKNVLQEQPENGEARFLLGLALAETGDYVSAEKEFRRALGAGYSSDKVYPELSRTTMRLGELRKVAEEFSKVPLTDPASRAAVMTDVGDARRALGQVGTAREAYAAALVAVPGYPRARVGQAYLTGMGGDRSGAMKMADELLAQHAAMPEALSLKAELLLAQGDRQQAEKLLRELVKVQPSNVAAWYALGNVLVRERRFDDATTVIQAMRKLHPNDVRPRYLAALVAYEKSDLPRAKEELQQITKGGSEHGPSLLLAGMVEYRLGAYELAEGYLRRVMAQSPNNLYTRQALAATYLRLGQPEKAEEVLAPALKAVPDNTALLRTAGEVELALGRPTEAARYYERALALDKDDAKTRTRMGQLSFARGDEEQALKDFEQASQVDQGDYQADLALIAAHTRRKEFDKALAAVATLEKKQPKNPLTFNVRGAVYLVKGDEKRARESFETALSLQYNYLSAATSLARLDLQAKQPDAAKRRFTSILEKDPKNATALIALAQVEAAVDTPAKGVAATLERAVNADPNSQLARLALINHYRQSGENKAALTAAQNAAATFPNDARVVDALGKAQLLNGETDLAIAAFTKVANLQPRSAQALAQLAGAQVVAKQYGEATNTLRKAIALQPDYGDAQRDLVVVQLAVGKPDDALRDAQRVQKAFPKESLGYILEGDIHLSQKRFDAAARAYGEALKRQRDPRVAVKQHQVLTVAGKQAEANALESRWLKENQKDPVLRAYLADVDSRNKDYASAARRYKELLSMEPESVLVLNNLAWSLGQLKDSSALGYAEKAYAKAPNDPAVQDTYGSLLLAKGDASGAVKLLGAAATAVPQSGEIRVRYARALIASGDKAGARRELEAVTRLDEKTPGWTEAQALLKSL